MCRSSWALALTLFVALPALGDTPQLESKKGRSGSGTTRFREGEVLVRFKQNVTAANVRENSLHSVGARSLRALERSEWVQVKARDGQTVEEAMAELTDLEEVAEVQPNYVYTIDRVPNDPQYRSLWAARNTGQTVSDAVYSGNNPGIAGKDLGLEGAWDVSKDCSSVVVAVIDSGINYSQADLVGNMWNGGSSYPKHGYDFVDQDNDPMDLNGHGTHVAGIIGATGNNGTGVAGICWKSKIMAVRVMDASGGGTTATIVNGVNFAVSQGAKILNLSLGGRNFDSAFNSAISNAASRGVVVVVAAGNEGLNNDSGSSPRYPCNYSQSNLICVAAVDQAFELASFSNYGATSVDVGAPGTNITSTWNGTSIPLVTDAFAPASAASWTSAGTQGSWGFGTRTLRSSNGTTSSYDFLMNPPDWNRSANSTVRYLNNMNARIYKSFNLSEYTSYAALFLDFIAFYDTQANKDFFSVAYRSSGGDPFSSPSFLDSTSGSSNGAGASFSYDLSDCRTANCSIGFKMTSDSSTASYGVGIVRFQISGLSLDSTSYETLQGTSMASPQVAGIAAMIMSYNPAYTVEDIVRAIREGGITVPSLAGKTTTGKAAHALGSLTYIAAPTGVTVAVQ